MGKTTGIGFFIMALACGACGDDDDDDGSDRDGGDAARGGSSGRGGNGGRGGATDPRGGNGGSGGSGSGDDASVDEDGGGDDEPMTFFVSSDGSMTGDLDGLSGADARCERLAQAVGRGSATWRAYLSAEGEGEDAGTPIHARDRIGTGPWHNSKGQLLAANLTALHALAGGNPDLFIDEKGVKVPGQWAGSPTPNVHDILTGSTADGMLLAGKACESWTSSSADLAAQVGHSDGLGPMMNPAPPYNSWNSSHENGGCNDTAPRGGGGRIYCFASD
ncbi:MAG TPA: hypothetical protein VK509_00310 [Polyangiales bacterium]|nr:hypothetical protein [Polyangiales bacterium]